MPSLAACASAPRDPGRVREYPGALRAPETLGRDVLWRQRVTAHWQGEGDAEGRRGFDAAVQCRGGVLTVLGLSPTGSVGFSVVLEDGVVELENHMPEHIPFPPRYVLLDVQRAFFPWLPSEPRADGARSGEVDGERITEVWRAGALAERSFERIDGEPAGRITIHYEWERPEWDVPTRAVLENAWFGYRLEIETHEELALDPGGVS